MARTASTKARAPKEALSAAALTPPRSRRRALAKPLVVTYHNKEEHTLSVVLINPEVLMGTQVGPLDILGYAAVKLKRSGVTKSAPVNVAAAEPGYGYLLYAIMAKFASKDGVESIRGSATQTRFAQTFWAKQPGGVIKPLSDAGFRKQFGMTYQTLVEEGDILLNVLSGVNPWRLGDSGVKWSAAMEKWEAVRALLSWLGHKYFDAYYNVSSTMDDALATEVPRPVSPRAGALALSRTRVSLADLALVKTSPNRAYLLSVPQGATTFGPENVVTRVRGLSGGYTPFASRAYKALPFLAEVDVLLKGAHAPETLPVAKRRVLSKMWERGEATKAALDAAGISEHDAFLDYLFTALESYYPRAFPASKSDEVLPFTRNPHRFPSSVRIFMPV
jgi:hypothetical protein